jgi:hypothetical protein
MKTAGVINVWSGLLKWVGGTFSFDGTGSTTDLFNVNGKGAWVLVEDVDFSGLAVGDYLVQSNVSNDSLSTVLFNRCKMPAWSGGGLIDADVGTPNMIAKFHSCHNSDIIYHFQENYYEGQVEQDTSIYLDATYDGSNGYSAKMVTTANAEEWIRPLRFKLADVWCSANPTIRVNFTNDGTTFQNDELWIEIEYPDSNTGAFGKIDTTSRPADILATAANLTTDGSSSWTGTGGFGAEVKQYISEIIANGQAGMHRVWVCLGKPSATVYVDPELDIS